MSGVVGERFENAEEAAQAFQRLHPRAFFERFVAQGVRPDGRGLQTAREVSVESGPVKTADGSAKVDLGSTSVVCGVRFMAGPPKNSEQSEEGEGEGVLQLTVKLLPVCSPQYEYRGSEKSIELTGFLSKVLEGSDFLDLKQLVIEPGVASFHLLADIVCLSDDGNLVDACLAALIAALKDLRLPDVKVVRDTAADITLSNGAGYQVVQDGPDSSNSLRLGPAPLSTTFGLFDSQLLVDPTHEELEVLDGVVTVVMDSKETVLAVFKPDGPPLSVQDIERCIDIAASFVSN